ncbi:MAG: hypothetical protein R3205_08015, partial [Psychrobacter sp.]|nr:hypothetical protein [Psychrobacter sp.]
QLGTHRLLCWDSTDELGFQKLMAGEKANLCLTDPPYDLDYLKASWYLKVTWYPKTLCLKTNHFTNTPSSS